jgi:hypothetical protein
LDGTGSQRIAVVQMSLKILAGFHVMNRRYKKPWNTQLIGYALIACRIADQLFVKFFNACQILGRDDTRIEQSLIFRLQCGGGMLLLPLFFTSI